VPTNATLQLFVKRTTKAIGHGDAQSDANKLLGMCNELGYGEAQVSALLDAAANSYKLDRGREMLLESFPELKDILIG